MPDNGGDKCVEHASEIDVDFRPNWAGAPSRDIKMSQKRVATDTCATAGRTNIHFYYSIFLSLVDDRLDLTTSATLKVTFMKHMRRSQHDSHHIHRGASFGLIDIDANNIPH